MMVLPEKVLI